MNAFALSVTALVAGVLCLAAAHAPVLQDPEDPDTDCRCDAYGHEGADGSGTEFENGYAVFQNPNFGGGISVAPSFSDGHCDCATQGETSRCRIDVTVTITGVGGAVCLEHSGGPEYGCVPNSACPPQYQCCMPADQNGVVTIVYQAFLNCGSYAAENLELATERTPPDCSADGVGDVVLFWHCEACAQQTTG